MEEGKMEADGWTGAGKGLVPGVVILLDPTAPVGRPVLRSLFPPKWPRADP